MILFSAVLVLNATTAMCNTNDLTKQKQNVRKQVNYALASSEISEKGTVTIYFYVFNKKVKVQKVEGSNEILNQKVKDVLEETGFNKKGLTGYYTVTIKLNGSLVTKFSDEDKIRLSSLMASSLSKLREVAITE